MALSGYCRGGMFPAADRAGREAALDDNKRAVDEALTLGCALPRARRRRPAEGRATAGSPRKDLDRRARDGARRHRRDCSNTRGPPACRSRSSRCIRCTPPIARASTRWRTRTICATSCPGARRPRHRGRRLSRLVGPESRRARSSARAGHRRTTARVPHLRLAGADDRPPARSRHDGRRRDRPSADPLVDGSAGYRGLHEVEIFSANNWWKRDPDEVLVTCIERHQTAC